MTFTVKGLYINRGERVSQKNQKTYYSILISQGSETLTLGVDAEHYAEASNLEQLQYCAFYVRPSARVGGQYGAFLSVYCDGWDVLEDLE